MKFTPKSYERLTVDFNEEWAQRVSEDEFVGAFPCTPWQDVPERGQELRKAWRVMNGKPVDGEPVERAAASDTTAEAAPAKPAVKKAAKKGDGV